MSKIEWIVLLNFCLTIRYIFMFNYEGYPFDPLVFIITLIIINVVYYGLLRLQESCEIYKIENMS